MVILKDSVRVLKTKSEEPYSVTDDNEQNPLVHHFFPLADTSQNLPRMTLIELKRKSEVKLLNPEDS